MPEFDPSQPYTVAQPTPPAQFDPSQPYTVAQPSALAVFDPSQPYKIASPTPAAITGPEGQSFQFNPTSGTQTDVAEGRDVFHGEVPPVIQGVGEALGETIPRTIGQGLEAVGGVLGGPLGTSAQELGEEPRKWADLYQSLQEGKPLKQAMEDAYGTPPKTFDEMGAKDWGKYIGETGLQLASALPFLGGGANIISEAMQPENLLPTRVRPEPPPTVSLGSGTTGEDVSAAMAQMRLNEILANINPPGARVSPETGFTHYPESQAASPIAQEMATLPPELSFPRGGPAPAIPPEDAGYAGQTAQPQSAPPVAPPQQAPEPGAIGANVKGFEQTYGAGEIPAGETITPSDAWDAAAERSATGKAQPYGITDRARTGAITPEEMGDLIYEHQQLLNAAGAAEGTPQYTELARRAKDFATNVVKPAENAWHRSGQTMQIAVKPDYTSVTGLINTAERMKSEIKASELGEATRIARENKSAQAKVSTNGQKLMDAMDREYGRGARQPVKTAEQLRNQLAGNDPCVI